MGSQAALLGLTLSDFKRSSSKSHLRKGWLEYNAQFRLKGDTERTME